MNICCLVRITLAHEIKGGMEVHVKTLSEGLVRLGHEVTILTTAHPKGFEHEVIAGVNIRYCKGTKPGIYSEEWGDASLKLLVKMHKKKPFDIIWGEGGGAFYYIRSARKRLKIPVVTFLQGSFLGDLRSQFAELKYNKNLILLFAKNFPKRIQEYFRRDLVFAKHADAVIGPSKACVRDAGIEYFLQKHKLNTTINGIDVQKFRPYKTDRLKLRDKFPIQNGAPLIFTASRLTREKGIHILIQAFPKVLKSVPDAFLLIAGVGPSKNRLKQQTKDLDLEDKIFFLGHIENTELAYYYNVCDLFVYPTLRHESFGISVAEAMACGCPVIAAKSGGISTSIDHGINGFLYKPHKPEKLVDLCIRLLKYPKLREQIGQSAREKAEKSLSSDKMIEDVLKVFNNIGLHN